MNFIECQSSGLLRKARKHGSLAEQGEFDGTVLSIFQRNEEHGLGAQAMIAEGLLERFPVEEIYAIHNLPGAPLGQVSTRPGQIC
jgi:metal-dependent amidase/aminoacylase/carboxypeptidase family protein